MQPVLRTLHARHPIALELLQDPPSGFTLYQYLWRRLRPVGPAKMAPGGLSAGTGTGPCGLSLKKNCLMDGGPCLNPERRLGDERCHSQSAANGNLPGKKRHNKVLSFVLSRSVQTLFPPWGFHLRFAKPSLGGMTSHAKTERRWSTIIQSNQVVIGVFSPSLPPSANLNSPKLYNNSPLHLTRMFWYG
jgi:hypothetical protein